mmetsp:Transcript_15343/g.31135  ORF Transcript_15343/g.31135 Transcript_15343/m.31135 type:complete len:89 (+) Transcript_15343:543-809(+)
MLEVIVLLLFMSCCRKVEDVRIDGDEALDGSRICTLDLKFEVKASTDGATEKAVTISALIMNVISTMIYLIFRLSCHFTVGSGLYFVR